MPRADLRAARDNRDFGTDKSKDSVGLLLHKIADCVRTVFRPCAIGDPRGRVAVRASSNAAVRCILLRLPMSASGHCALRAPTMFSVRMKSTSVPKTWLLIKACLLYTSDAADDLLC